MAQPAAALDLPLSIVPVIAASQKVDGSALVAVDPYIDSAEFFEDLNNNGVKDAGEQGSTVSNGSGQCGFSQPLTVGSTIVANVAGTHNGVPYSLTLKRKVERGMTTPIIISPSTTLASHDLTPTQIAAMLGNFGLSITADMVTQDPMTNMAALGGAAEDSDLLKLRAAIVAYTFLRVREGSDAMKALTGDQLYASAMGQVNVEPVATILNTMAIVVTNCLSKASLTAAQNSIPNGAPELTIMDIIQTAVAIADRLALIGYSTCNSTGGNWGAALAAVQTAFEDNIQNAAPGSSWIDKLGMRYYGYRNRVALGPALGSLPADVEAGVTSVDGIWHIDTNEAIAAGTP